MNFLSCENIEVLDYVQKTQDFIARQIESCDEGALDELLQVYYLPSLLVSDSNSRDNLTRLARVFKLQYNPEEHFLQWDQAREMVRGLSGDKPGYDRLLEILEEKQAGSILTFWKRARIAIEG